MEHRSASIKFLRSTGLIPVKVRPGQKDPFPEWDPRVAAISDNSAVLRQLESDPELNLGALFAGRYVDVDIDSDSPFLMQALDYFLPRTQFIWGRESKRRSHRVYALLEDFDRATYGSVLRYIKALVGGVIDDYSYSVELRGGKPENGLYSVLPGSIHPSGEHVEWDADIDPTLGGVSVDLERLIRSIRLAVAAAILVPHWSEGRRNDISLALAGTLWRIRTSTRAAYGLEPDEDAEGYFVLTDDDAKAILSAVMAIAGDDANDKRSRLLNLSNTWRKLDGEAGAKVTGGKVLAELIGGTTGPSVVKALYRLLSDNDAAEQIEALAEQFVMWYGPGVILDLHMVASGRANPWMTREQATNSLAGKKIIIGNTKIRVSDMLFGSAIIQRTYGLTFDPGCNDLLVQTPDGLQVNQWRGFATQPSSQTVSKSEVEPFLTYIYEVIADGKEERYRWVLGWLADMLQKPHQKPGTALVLVGVQGAGKTFLGEQVMGKIIGPSHYQQINSIAKLTDKFNSLIDNKVFLQCDESIHSYQKDAASRLKSVITDETMVIEPKGINSYSKPNHLHLIFTSNDETAAIFIDPSPFERRFTVLKVSSRYANDMIYWTTMRAWTTFNLPKIMRYLMDYEYDRALISRPLQTEAKVEIQKIGLDPEVAWILSRVADGFPIAEKHHEHWFNAFKKGEPIKKDTDQDVRFRSSWPDRIQQPALEADFKDFVRGHGRPVYSGSVITTIKRILPPRAMEPAEQITVRWRDERSGRPTQERIRLYTFPTQSAILEHLHGRYGPAIFTELDKFKETDVVAQPNAVTEKEEY